MASCTLVYVDDAIVSKHCNDASPGRDAAINKKAEGRAGHAINKPVDPCSGGSLYVSNNSYRGSSRCPDQGDPAHCRNRIAWLWSSDLPDKANAFAREFQHLISQLGIACSDAQEVS